MMHLTQSLHKALQERPEATALVCGERRKTFAQFAGRVARLAAVLRALGLQPGGRVAMLGLNSDRYVEYLYAAWWAGGVINPVNTRWSAREVAYSLDDCDTRILLVDEHFQALVPSLRSLSGSLQSVLFLGNGAAPDGLPDAETLIAAAVPVADALRHGDDLAAVMYTGGTTGLPKGSCSRTPTSTPASSAPSRPVRVPPSRWASAWRRCSMWAVPASRCSW
jgi:acyl-CoA synthetase (AMP-forming)/AMP-acid ligase II